MVEGLRFCIYTNLLLRRRRIDRSVGSAILNSSHREAFVTITAALRIDIRIIEVQDARIRGTVILGRSVEAARPATAERRTIVDTSRRKE